MDRRFLIYLEQCSLALPDPTLKYRVGSGNDRLRAMQSSKHAVRATLVITLVITM